MNKNLRISAACLARVELDDKLLVGLNKKRLEVGRKVYTPFGGALEFYNSARPFLDSLGVDYEKGDDLRFRISADKWTQFEEWFDRRKDREISPYRELREEFVEEELVFPTMPEEAYSLDGLVTVKPKREATDRPGQEGVMTQRIFEVHRVLFVPNYESMVREALAKDDTRLALITQDEIRSGKTLGGIEVASNCAPLIYE
jgi:hypothetical protein